jgi:hypothetical protein
VELGPDGLRAVDAALCRHSGRGWRKVAAVLASAVGEVDPGRVSEAHLDLYLRRLNGLVDAGVLECPRQSQTAPLERGPAGRVTRRVPFVSSALPTPPQRSRGVFVHPVWPTSLI